MISLILDWVSLCLLIGIMRTQWKDERFFYNTRSWCTPVTGGSNIPTLNDLLAPFGIVFGDKILNGDFSIDGKQSRYAYGTDIVKILGGGYVHSFPFLDSSESGGNSEHPSLQHDQDGIEHLGSRSGMVTQPEMLRVGSFDEDDGDGVQRDVTMGFVALMGFVLLFTLFCLVNCGASRPHKARVSVKLKKFTKQVKATGLKP